MPARSTKRSSGKTCVERKMHRVMSEFKGGTLHSGSGGIVKSRKQAIAIALSESRRKCGK